MGPERFREFADVGADQVIVDEAGEFPEPERGNLRQHLPLVGNAVRKDDVKSGKTVCRDDQKGLSQVVHVADLSLF